MATSDAPRPWTDPDYKSFVRAIEADEGASLAGGDEYQQLMAKETRVLETVDRVVNDAQFLRGRESEFLARPLREVGERAVAEAQAAFEEALAARTPRALGEALLGGERKIYLGLALLALAVLLFFVSASS
jgi:hypothetical protein